MTAEEDPIVDGELLELFVAPVGSPESEAHVKRKAVLNLVRTHHGDATIEAASIGKSGTVYVSGHRNKQKGVLPDGSPRYQGFNLTIPASSLESEVASIRGRKGEFEKVI